MRAREELPAETEHVRRAVRTNQLGQVSLPADPPPMHKGHPRSAPHDVLHEVGGDNDNSLMGDATHVPQKGGTLLGV